MRWICGLRWSTVRLKNRMAHLARACRQRPPAPVSPETVEQAKREVQDLFVRLKARKEEIDAALAGPDPRRRAWAQRQLDAVDTPARRAQRAEVAAMLETMHARHAKSGGR